MIFDRVLCSRWCGLVIGSAVTLWAVAAGASAENSHAAPQLAAAANFSQGWNESLLRAALDLPVRSFRDSLRWSDIEATPGTYLFDRPTTRYPDSISGELSLTVNWGNPLYDGGGTPYTPDGTAAHGRFVVEALARFPTITAVEVGNEFNGANFVKGRVLEDGLDARPGHYLAFLRGVHEAVKRGHPEVRILGGATHSIPAGYLWKLFDLGAGQYLDALAIHPYTTVPEQLAEHIGVLRRHPAIADLPIQVTEFGSPDPEKAPAHLLKSYAAMSTLGIERVVWYPLNPRGDSMVPLVDAEGSPTAAGRAYAHIQATLQPHRVRDVSPDPFTYAYLFGDRTLVIWGEPRTIDLAESVSAFDSTGKALSPKPERTHPDQPIILSADQPIALGRQVRLGSLSVRADSFHQFSFPADEEQFAAGDPLQRFARKGEQVIPLRTMPGQHRKGTPWNPYLGARHHRFLRVTPNSLSPDGGEDEPIEIVHRYVAREPQTVAVEAEWRPGRSSDDGITVSVTHEGSILAEQSVIDRFSLSLPSVTLKADDRLDFVVGPNGNPRGDETAFRIRVLERGE